MPTKRVNWKIAFDPVTGDHQSYPRITYEYDRFGSSATKIEPEWREQFSFEDILEYQHYTRGRSALNFIWKSKTTGIHYEMFLAQLDDALPYIVGGCLTGTFDFVKYGNNTGIRFQL